MKFHSCDQNSAHHLIQGAMIGSKGLKITSVLFYFGFILCLNFLGEQKRIENLKRQMGLLQENKMKKKKKKGGNPNPLSCLKSKKKSKEPLRNVQQKMESEGKKKKRKRIRKKKAAS